MPQLTRTPPSSPSHAPASPHPLTPVEVERSRAKHGSNHLSRRRRRSFARQFLSNFSDPVIRILLCALGLNLLFAFKGADWFETGGIALAVFLATLISTLSEYGSEAAFSRLSEACAHTVCRVRRATRSRANVINVNVCEISIEEIVVGDTVLVGAGEMIPADGVLLSGRLTVDQSAMTGESREVDKTPLADGGMWVDTPGNASSPHHPSALFRGCTVLGGNGEMLVTRVGDKTFLGEISAEVQADTRESPLKIRLSKLASQISRLGYVAAVLVALVFLAQSFLIDSGFDRTVILAKLSDWRYVWQQLFGALTLGLTVLVVAVPEGLPMMIAVVLSSNIQKMVRDEVLVRKPAGIEAAGSMNLLFTDKTGTLTEGRLSVGRILTAWTDFDSPAALASASPTLLSFFADACRTNTSSTAGTTADTAAPCALGGNATDRALLDAVLPFVTAAEGGLVPTSPSLILAQTPFDSEKKCSTATVRRGGRAVTYVKGAPERILPRISTAYAADGKRAPLDRRALERRIRDLTSHGGRVILLAEADGTSDDRAPLALVCAVLLEDRPRAEAPAAVAELRGAGIHIVMMTGDNRDTARAIAASCGILGDGVDLVLDSEELSRMTDGRVRELLPRIGVIARALPTDKSRMVRIAQEADLVVGMTGDGINDAPALRRADIGFAMGSGTQVAKDAGDIIIMDNNLASISRAVLYGRTIFKSIRKFITLQLTMNASAVGVTMLAPLLGVQSPVTVVQMLWINLIMDTLGGLAFAGEAPLPAYMKEKPKRRDEPILNRYMVGEIAWLSFFTVLLCLLFLKHPAITWQFRQAPDNIYLLTAFFALFIFASVFNCFNARTDRLRPWAGLSRNRAFTLIMTAVLAIQIVFVYLGGAVLRTAPLTPRELAVTFALALTVFPAELIRKIFRRLSGKGEGY